MFVVPAVALVLVEVVVSVVCTFFFRGFLCFSPASPVLSSAGGLPRFFFSGFAGSPSGFGVSSAGFFPLLFLGSFSLS